MGDSQNSRLDDNQPPTNDKSDSRDGSYYYDDSTGYEIYDEETETEEDIDDDDCQSRP